MVECEIQESDLAVGLNPRLPLVLFDALRPPRGGGRHPLLDVALHPPLGAPRHLLDVIRPPRGEVQKEEESTHLRALQKTTLTLRQIFRVKK